MQVLNVFIFTLKTMANSFILVIFRKKQIVFQKNMRFESIAGLNVRINTRNASSERPSKWKRSMTMSYYCREEKRNKRRRGGKRVALNEKIYINNNRTRGPVHLISGRPF